MTISIKNNDSSVIANAKQYETGTYVVVANDKEKLFEYNKPTYNIDLLKFIIEHKLLNCVCLN